MIMLMRSLIRYYWDEFDYNPHWGGESPMALLSGPENPLVRPPQLNDHFDEFSETLEWPPYPDSDKGVAVYAGFDEGGMRHLNFAISRTNPSSFTDLKRRLLGENFFDVEPDLEALIAPFIDEIGFELPAGEVWHRARLGTKASYYRHEIGFHQTVMHKPWSGKDIGAPPPPIAGVGRLNRAGVSVLYLASDSYTAVAEIRPHPGHYVSIGGFRSVEALRIADFNPDIWHFSANDDRLDLYAIIQAFDRHMSIPVTPDEKASYLVTQLLAEVLRRRGFDGVRFRSSVSDGSNICIFRPAGFQFDDSHSQVVRVASVKYEAPPVPHLLEPTGQDYEIE